MNKIIHYFTKIRRAKRIALMRKKIPPYLKGDFTIELNYKLWVTKGARFVASSRSKKIHELSSMTVGYLSAYLIIINLLNIYNLDFYTNFSNEHLAVITTSFSILILLFSQFESSKKYNVISEKYHQCAIEIAELYNELRIIKTFKTFNQTREAEIINISNKYDLILKKYENHEQIDTEYFKISKPEYFELNSFKVLKIKLKRYFVCYFKYHVFMFGPILLLILYQLISD